MSEPVAFEYQHEETGVIGYIDQWQIDNGFFDNNPRLQLIGPLYRHSPKADLEQQLAELREALNEAMGWNWLDDDMNDEVANRLYALLQEKGG